jgi:uncharacterized membrane protein YukC
MRVHIKLMTEEKTITVNISDTEAVAEVAGVDADAHALMEDLHEFFQDVIASNPDAHVVEITPENAIEVLGAAKRKKKKAA